MLSPAPQAEIACTEEAGSDLMPKVKHPKGMHDRSLLFVCFVSFVNFVDRFSCTREKRSTNYTNYTNQHETWSALANSPNHHRVL